METDINKSWILIGLDGFGYNFVKNHDRDMRFEAKES